MTLVTCPRCGERSLQLGDGDVRCKKCKWTASPRDAADEYARKGDSDWKHPKHGPDDEIGTCDLCGYDAVVPLHPDDNVGKVQQKIGTLWKKLKLEPGAGDAGFSICLSCGEPHYGMPANKDGW